MHIVPSCNNTLCFSFLFSSIYFSLLDPIDPSDRGGKYIAYSVLTIPLYNLQSTPGALILAHAGLARPMWETFLNSSKTIDYCTSKLYELCFRFPLICPYDPRTFIWREYPLTCGTFHVRSCIFPRMFDVSPPFTWAFITSSQR